MYFVKNRDGCTSSKGYWLFLLSHLSVFLLTSCLPVSFIPCFDDCVHCLLLVALPLQKQASLVWLSLSGRVILSFACFSMSFGIWMDWPSNCACSPLPLLSSPCFFSCWSLSVWTKLQNAQLFWSKVFIEWFSSHGAGCLRVSVFHLHVFSCFLDGLTFCFVSNHHIYWLFFSRFHFLHFDAYGPTLKHWGQTWALLKLGMFKWLTFLSLGMFSGGALC